MRERCGSAQLGKTTAPVPFRGFPCLHGELAPALSPTSTTHFVPVPRSAPITAACPPRAVQTRGIFSLRRGRSAAACQEAMNEAEKGLGTGKEGNASHCRVHVVTQEGFVPPAGLQWVLGSPPGLRGLGRDGCDHPDGQPQPTWGWRQRHPAPGRFQGKKVGLGCSQREDSL